MSVQSPAYSALGRVDVAIHFVGIHGVSASGIAARRYKSNLAQRLKVAGLRASIGPGVPKPLIDEFRIIRAREIPLKTTVGVVTAARRSHHERRLPQHRA